MICYSQIEDKIKELIF